MAGGFGFNLDLTNIIGGSEDTSQSVNGTQTKQKVLSKEAFNKIVYDILSSDQGLANIVSGENVSGGYGGTTKSLLAQDLVTKIAGELANITAPETITTNTQSNASKDTGLLGGALSVICTELKNQGKISADDYEAGKYHFKFISPITIRGYHAWAYWMTKKMQSSEKLSNFWQKIVQARYDYILNKRFTLVGWSTVWIVQPICYIIGLFVGEKDGGPNPY